MKLTENQPNQYYPTIAKLMKVGQMARLLEVPYEGHIILRIYEGFVDLNNPMSTWGEGATLKVELLPPGYQIILEQE